MQSINQGFSNEGHEEREREREREREALSSDPKFYGSHFNGSEARCSPMCSPDNKKALFVVFVFVFCVRFFLVFCCVVNPIERPLRRAGFWLFDPASPAAG